MRNTIRDCLLWLLNVLLTEMAWKNTDSSSVWEMDIYENVISGKNVEQVRWNTIPSASQCQVLPGPPIPQDMCCIQSKICPLHEA